jgi:hypothetical protein
MICMMLRLAAAGSKCCIDFSPLLLTPDGVQLQIHSWVGPCFVALAAARRRGITGLTVYHQMAVAVVDSHHKLLSSN